MLPISRRSSEGRTRRPLKRRITITFHLLDIRPSIFWKGRDASSARISSAGRFLYFAVKDIKSPNLSI
jgi:hypothetical protein